MCRRITCPNCQKPSFAGCGMHVEQVLTDVPKEKRCQCSNHEKSNGKSTKNNGPLFSPIKKLFS